MTAHAWESFTARLLDIGINIAQGFVRIALLIAIAYVATKLLRMALNRLESFLVVCNRENRNDFGCRSQTYQDAYRRALDDRLWFSVVCRGTRHI